MKNILITGGKGFIGRNLTEGLVYKYHVFSPGHAELDVLNLDLLIAYVIRNKIDIIVHTAIHVPMINGKEHEMFNDLLMFLNLEKVSGFVEKIIYFGSGAEFDKRRDIRNISEDDFGLYIPSNEYGLAKYTMTKIARSSRNIYNIRLFGIFGKYELWDIKFLSNLCCKAVYGLPLSIRKDCEFNFVSVRDLNQVVEWMIENEPMYKDYNFCHDTNYDLSELAEMVKEISRKPLDIVFLSDERNRDYTAVNTRLRNEFPNLMITDMFDALEDLYQYYLVTRDRIDYTILKESK